MTHLLMNRDRGYAGNVATDANMVMWIREIWRQPFVSKTNIRCGFESHHDYQFMKSQETTKDSVLEWLEQKQEYDLRRRLAFVPDDDVEKYILFKPKWAVE